MQRRNARTDAILREILLKRGGFEVLSTGGASEPGPEIHFHVTSPRPEASASRGRRVLRWLFINGGFSVVLLVGLMALGIIGVIFERL